MIAEANEVEFDVRTDEMLVSMGPQHPSTHGVLRLVLKTDGELVSNVVPHLGYLHRCAEKIGENVTPIQFIPYTDRMDYLAAMNMNLGYSLVRAGHPREGPGSARTAVRTQPHCVASRRHGGVWIGPRQLQSVPLCLPRTGADSRSI
jgi:hypothetical protein